MKTNYPAYAAARSLWLVFSSTTRVQYPQVIGPFLAHADCAGGKNAHIRRVLQGAPTYDQFYGIAPTTGCDSEITMEGESYTRPGVI